MYLTPDFKLSEFLDPEDTPPSLTVVENLHRLAERLQVIRDILNRPIHIMSGYRSKEMNARKGGDPNSYHIKGMAADINVKGMTPREVQAFLKNWSGGLGSYNAHTHIDIRPTKARWIGTSK